MFGVVWLAFTLGLYFFLKSSAVPDMEFPTLSVGIGALFLVAGVPMLISGLINARKRQGEENKVMAQGVATTGKVTFVDKNYNVLVNEKPIYSIVEFTFRDSSGMEQTGRKEDVDSDLVIRNRIEVGGEVSIKYLPENPKENILILTDPRSGEQEASI